jgi:hypothetical protein
MITKIFYLWLATIGALFLVLLISIGIAEVLVPAPNMAPPTEQPLSLNQN